ncbi:MAG: ATP-binding cassette domain-containing protein [Deferribacteraceae bacterium]|nr:ATP-binding cassette domain-containing protein [Deferribacteraceae bacterium]
MREISLDISSNVIYGIIGKSGAGKSTLVRLISLLERPDGGAILFDGERVDNLTGKALLDRRRRLGMIFQNFNLFSSRNVFGNVAYPLEIAGEPKNKIKGRVKELLALVGLEDKEKSQISKLSGGQKQRVAIARALANYPEILFCDEATSALDPQTTISILELIKDIQNKMNLTVVMITHHMEVVREICDYVSIIDDGVVVESGLVKDMFLYPHTETAREFLRALKPIEEKELLSGQPSCAYRYRLHFAEDTVKKPVLAELIRQFQLDISILSATIHTVAEIPIGEMIVDMSGVQGNIDQALQWLAEHSVAVESIDA